MTKNHGRRRRAGARALAGAAAVVRACTGLAGCAGASPAASSTASPGQEGSGKPVVLATFSVIADLVREVGGDRVEVLSITKPGAEIHGYEPTPSDLAKIHEADLVLDNGLGLERWFERFVRDLDAPHAVLSEGIEPESITAGAYTGKANPHAWMSPVQARIYVANAERALAALSPRDADYFAERAATMNAKLKALEADARERLADHPGAALVTCEGAFSYLARDLGLREHYLWPVNADAEGTPRQIREQIAFVQEHDVPAVYCESTVNDGAQRRVAEATGARLAGPLYVDSISGPDGPVPTFLDLVAYDLDLIMEGLPQ